MLVLVLVEIRPWRKFHCSTRKGYQVTTESVSHRYTACLHKDVAKPRVQQ